ncbi:MAG: ATP-binding protein, partial [Thermincolia bacterium]
QNIVALLNTQAIISNIRIVTEYDINLPSIDCDENQLRQVFVNILKNAIEAMPGGGEILIKVKPAGDNMVLIRFIDEGYGIPEDKMPRIGEPFYTTKENGTGLGLMVSYKIIENHQGRIEVSSKINKGTTFDIILPVAR